MGKLAKCWQCDEVRPCLSCSGCRVAKYCSTDCQRANWVPEHRRDCPELEAAAASHGGQQQEKLERLSEQMGDLRVELRRAEREAIHWQTSNDRLTKELIENEAGCNLARASRSEAHAFLVSETRAVERVSEQHELQRRQQELQEQQQHQELQGELQTCLRRSLLDEQDLRRCFMRSSGRLQND
ncbi:unnamed protein product [Polarella glacialis]|uniref:MYND-type domain-containing protein n=1 Tax=Polarella glacialis TaxID=89957 RepID=A0A813D8D1_POLGL|nr:unnamed protein product [Polarella glacialis]